jgi:uncharacterized protein YjdB
MITVTTTDGSKKASLSVTVPAPVPVTVPVQTVSVSSVSISPSTLTLSVNQTYQVISAISPPNATNKSVTWSSSNANIVTVSSSGLLTARTSGTSTITATTADGSKMATLSVSVPVQAPSVPVVTISPSIVTLTVDQTYQVNTSIVPPNSNNKDLTWKSTDVNVAMVSSSGLVRAISRGTTVIVATAADGKKMSVTIDVTPVKVNVSRFVTPHSITSVNTNSARMGHMKVSVPDIDHTLVVKSCMKYKNE